ncbi:hypothetical protein ACHAQA_006749 [Verticillium albo-atrum]
MGFWLALGSAPDWETEAFDGFTLDSDSNTVATIDYGHIVGGVPWFEVSHLSGPAQLEMKYSEEFRGVEAPFADGPFLYGNQLGANFRVETLNITQTGISEAFLVQGGQRWESIRLVSNGTISISQVGFHATFPNINPEEEPGQFDSDNERLNEIWKLGVRGAEVSCLEKGTQPATWRVDPEKGALIEALRPIQSDKAPSIGNSTLVFETSIERGGLWWGLAWGIGSGAGIGLQLTGDLPEETTFANHNYTLSPRNTLQVTWGWGQVNQTTLTTYALETFDLPFPVHEKTWYNVSTKLENGWLSADINGTQIMNMTMEPYRVLWRGQMVPIELNGRFGIGAYQDQKAYYRNLALYDQQGRSVYENTLTSDDILAEYGVQTNLFPVCLDGPKRDRLIWLGDYYHTARIIGVSTGRFDLQKGTFLSLFPTQLETGQFSMASPLGYEPNVTVFSSLYGLEDYQLLGLLSYYYFIRDSNDLAFTREHWSELSLLVDWSVSKINATDGLVHLAGSFTGPATAGSSVSCLTVYSLRSMAELATAVDDFDSAERWEAAADELAQNIQERLWNESLGVWSLSTADPSDYSVTGTAFCIAGGVATPTQANRSIAALDGLALGPGYLDSTKADAASPTASVSPNTNGFLLSSLFAAGAPERGAALIDSLWSPMVDDVRTASGASWEYVMHDGTPGLGLFTSLGHPWGGGATYVLTEWAAGVRSAEGVRGYGYRNWVVAPETGLAMGLRRAHARVPTAFGGMLDVRWEVSGDMLKVVVKAPAGTSGTFMYGDVEKRLCGREVYEFKVKSD